MNNTCFYPVTNYHCGVYHLNLLVLYAPYFYPLRHKILHPYNIFITMERNGSIKCGITFDDLILIKLLFYHLNFVFSSIKCCITVASRKSLK